MNRRTAVKSAVAAVLGLLGVKVAKPETLPLRKFILPAKGGVYVVSEWADGSDTWNFYPDHRKPIRMVLKAKPLDCYYAGNLDALAGLSRGHSPASPT